MKFIKALYITMVLAISPILAFAQNISSENFFLHTITKGQSLYSIASMYHVSVDDIIKLNPGSEEVIKEGKTLKIPQHKIASNQTFHTIQPGETLYRLTVKYNVSASAICQANPGLSAENFRAGQVIAIPTSTIKNEVSQQKEETNATTVEMKQTKWQDMHKVKRGETIYSISRDYHITEDELIAANPELKSNKLKKGAYLAIPYHNQPQQAVAKTQDPTNDELFSKNKQVLKSISKIKAAIILPFGTRNDESGNEKSRMVEYYQGLLMAADSLKNRGISMDLYAYDSGKSTATINSIIKKKELKQMDIIFGPFHTDQIKLLADFAKENKIRLVIPFSSKDKEVFTNPYIYQINTPQSYLYSEVYEHFIRKFQNANVIFLDANDTEGNKAKADFIKGLKTELKDKNISYKELKGDNIVSESLYANADTLKNNIFIPISGSNVTLIKLLPQLVILTREHPGYQIHLFGYPEWQTYTNDHLNDFYEMDTFFYSSFYTNNMFPESIHFSSAYRKWYGKDMANTYPKYGMLGFDTAYYLLYGLSRYGNNLEEHLNKLNFTPIQTGFKFERVNNWGGFINKKVFFVHFSKNGELVKLDFE